MKNKNGIPVDIPGQRFTKPQATPKKHFVHKDYHKYSVFLTMQGYELGHRVIVVVPQNHKDVKALKKQGFHIIERWTRHD